MADDGSAAAGAALSTATGVYQGVCLFVYHLPPTCNETVL